VVVVTLAHHMVVFSLLLLDGTILIMLDSHVDGFGELAGHGVSELIDLLGFFLFRLFFTLLHRVVNSVHFTTLVKHENIDKVTSETYACSNKHDFAVNLRSMDYSVHRFN